MSIKDWYPEVLKLRGHIAELEAGYRNQRDAKEALVERIAELKDTIKRVNELPKRWRVEVLGGIARRHDNVRDCADELEEALEQNDAD